MAKKSEKCDFSGWATRCNIKCSDGRTIRKNAFKDQDGQKVPLVWNHNHLDADNVLGHALLENREEGVYAYCSFNESENAATAKELVRHGDICSLSIYANQLKQNGGDVIHGAIREVSLVLAGANPGAKIENVMAHGDEGEGAIMYNASETLELDTEIVMHSDKQEEEKTEVNNEKENDKTVEDVINSLTEEQKTVVYALIGAALEDGGATDDENDENEGDNKVKHNAFENTDVKENVLTHSDFLATIEAAKKLGSMRDAFHELALAHGCETFDELINGTALAHSITNIDNLFPEAQAINNTPTTINYDTTWVGKVMAGVHHTPFSRVKMMAIDITADEARARGYVKGNKKVEEVITSMKRTTNPQTVYKLQKLDRDDIIDIKDFDVVAYIKNEMRGKLNEELARAILIGDGRLGSSADKINPLNIRPILGDDSTYVVAKYLERDNKDESQFAKYFIKSCIKARKDYKGSGNPTLFCTEDLLTDMLLIEDKNERIIYDTMDKLKTALRVSDIVTVPVFENHTRETETHTYKLMGVLVNLNDYNVGADRQGDVDFFEDFDINFNKYEYLIETRCSGAMVMPYGAITFEEKTAKVSEPAEDSGQEKNN